MSRHARPHQLSVRRKQHKEKRQRGDWFQRVVAAAQLASSIAAWIGVIRSH
jgi:hypothetical protein